MSEAIKRFYPDVRYIGSGDYVGCMEAWADGEFVLYSDHAAEVERLRRLLAGAEEAIRLLAWSHCEDCGGTGVVWAGNPDDPQESQCESCWYEGWVRPPSDPFPIGQRMSHPAVRRALCEIGGEG